jgi:hypothetical protein
LQQILRAYKAWEMVLKQPVLADAGARRATIEVTTDKSVFLELHRHRFPQNARCIPFPVVRALDHSVQHISREAAARRWEAIATPHRREGIYDDGREFGDELSNHLQPNAGAELR